MTKLIQAPKDEPYPELAGGELRKLVCRGVGLAMGEKLEELGKADNSTITASVVISLSPEDQTPLGPFLVLKGAPVEIGFKPKQVGNKK